jgi:hypothetical protein
MQPGLDSPALDQITLDIESAMKNPENINIFFRLDQIGNTIMSVEENADFSACNAFIPMTDLGKLSEYLRSLVEMPSTTRTAATELSCAIYA